MNKEQNKPICKEYDGYKEWWLNDKLHREDGPAFEGTDGYKEWYLNGKHYEEKEYWKEYWKELHNRGLIDDTELFEKLL